jgi:hypothetical protein
MMLPHMESRVAVMQRYRYIPKCAPALIILDVPTAEDDHNFNSQCSSQTCLLLSQQSTEESSMEGLQLGITERP